VILQLDMEVADAANLVVLPDGCAVDQLAGRDQHAIEIERVVGRDHQLGMRQPVAERALGDAHRAHQFGPRMGGDVHLAGADPLHRLDRRALAGERHHPVTHPQILDRHFAALGQDARAGSVTGCLLEGLHDVGDAFGDEPEARERPAAEEDVRQPLLDIQNAFPKLTRVEIRHSACSPPRIPEP